MQTKKIRTAVVGFGISGQVFHAPLIKANTDYSLDVIVTGNAERIAVARQRYPLAKIVANLQELLRLIDSGECPLDLLVLSTPPAGHRVEAEAAIARGLNLVIDKPFVSNSAEGAELIALAKKAGTALTVFQNRRWDGDFLTVQKLVNEHALGNIYSFESRFEWWKPQGFGNWRDLANISQGGGLLFDLGSHLIDQAIQLFGPVIESYAELARHAPPLSDADEDSFISLIHENGIRSRLWMNGSAARQGARFHLLGSDAAFTKFGLDNQELMLSRGISPDAQDYGVEPKESWGMFGLQKESKAVVTERGNYPAFYRELASALFSGTTLPVDAESSLAVLEVIEDLHRRYRVRQH